MNKTKTNSEKILKVGRHSLTLDETDSIFRKLEPYLKNGLSLYMACLQAQIPKSTVYDLLNENSEFAEKVMLAKKHRMIIVGDIISKELMRIVEYQKKPFGALSPQHFRFVQWLSNKLEDIKDNSDETNNKTYETQKSKETS